MTEPPGEIIYRTNDFVVHEIDGADNYRYCQSLCLLSKLFLDHKTIFYAIHTFTFYVLAEFDEEGKQHVVGFFSKEHFSMNNLACIMVLPPYQRKGYGKFLIQLSYTLSAREGYIGSPEKPLSDLGKVSYKSLWWYVLVNTLDAMGVEGLILVTDLSRMSGIHVDDVISTFEPYQCIKRLKDGIYVTASENYMAFFKSLPIFVAPKLFLDIDCLNWTSRYQPNTPEASEDESFQQETKNEEVSSGSEEDNSSNEESNEENSSDSEESENEDIRRQQKMDLVRRKEVKIARREQKRIEQEDFIDPMRGYIGCFNSEDEDGRYFLDVSDTEDEGDYWGDYANFDLIAKEFEKEDQLRESDDPH